MLYAYNTIKVHSIIFISCVVFYLISPEARISPVSWRDAITSTGKVATGMVETVSLTGKTNPKKTVDQWNSTSMANCWPDCKIATLTWIGIDPKLAYPLVSNCKRLTENPVHCIIAWASIMVAESGWNLKNCYKKWCMWVGKFSYDTYEQGVIDWIWRYMKYWYKAKSASFFYPPKWEVSRSRYCMSEISSGSELGCPNWLSHASKTWNYLLTIF